MSRAMWTGMLSFGLVSIPVGLHSATEEHGLEFHQFEQGTSDRIRNKRVNERTGQEVPFARIVKGVDVGGGDLVIVSREELEQVAPGRSRLLSIVQFVDVAEIDAVFFQNTYYLAPTGDGSARPYRLLLEALARTNRAAVASFVMREKEYVAAIRADGDVLTLSTLHFADEVRDPHVELPDLPDATQVRGKELDMAVQLIESLVGRWLPGEYHDTYTERVRDLVESKRSGGELVAAPEAPPATEVVNLMEVLRRSVQEADARRHESAPRADRVPTTPAAKAPADPGDADGLADRTKADLGRIARQLVISGRSTMTKDQLVDAIRYARANTDTRKAS